MINLLLKSLLLLLLLFCFFLTSDLSLLVQSENCIVQLALCLELVNQARLAKVTDMQREKIPLR